MGGAGWGRGGEEEGVALGCAPPPAGPSPSLPPVRCRHPLTRPPQPTPPPAPPLARSATFDTDFIDIGPVRRQYLDHRLERVWEHNSEGSIPYVPVLRAPYYVWVGRVARAGHAPAEAPVEAPPQFPPTFLYTQSWEDPRPDAKALRIAPGDSCLTLTSGGCNALNLLLLGAGSVVAVDCNPAQSALLELKAVALRRLPFDDVWRLFGDGVHPNARQLFEAKLAPFLSQASADFWRARMWYFDHGLYYQGGRAMDF